MLAQIIQSNNYCYIYFAGQTKEEYLEYAQKLSVINNKYWSGSKGAWECPLDSYKYIKDLFELQVDYNTIGSELKLHPYEYQKKLIYDILIHKELLLVSPCGSGKTIIGIGAYLELKKNRLINPNSIGIILVKATLKLQWLNEVSKFSEAKANIIKSNAEITSGYRSKIKKIQSDIKKLNISKNKALIKQYKSKIKEYELSAKDAFNQQFDGYDLLILNYEALKDEAISQKLKTLNIEYIFADEVHKISNRKAQLSQAAYEFNYIKYKIGATATAISNNPENIFGLYSFVAPELFPSYSQFAKNYIKYAGYGRVIGVKNAMTLANRYKNNIVVVTKEEISKQLPSLTVIQQYCELTEEQNAMIHQILDELKEAKDKEYNLSKNTTNHESLENNPEYMSIKAQIMMLQTFAQELSDDPRLLLASDSKYAMKYSLHHNQSPKTELALDLVLQILESGEKVIIISRYVRMLELLEQDIIKKFGPNIKIAKVDGSMSDKDRYDNIYTKFRDDPTYNILLMSDAGSTGTNASTAQYIIEFDLAESYATQTQRHGRIERADSTHKNVFVYQLIAKDSYDEIQQAIVNKKEAYDSDLIKIFANTSK